MERTKILTNKIRCKLCDDIIESRTVHDYVTCTCGAVSVDGGHFYLRRCGNMEDWEELSEVVLAASGAEACSGEIQD